MLEHCRVSVEALDGPVQVRPGSSIDLRVEVRANGTGASVDLETEAPIGWNAEVIPGQLEIPPGESAVAVLRARAPRTPGPADLWVHLTHDGGQAAVAFPVEVVGRRLPVVRIAAVATGVGAAAAALLWWTRRR